MAARANPYAIKIHRTYDVNELAAKTGVHKNTVRHWQKEGLQPIDGNRPVLFHGASIRAFLGKRNASRKNPCSPGTLYCFRCRAPSKPALNMVDYHPMSATSGNLSAICVTCETVMHRRARLTSLTTIMPGCDIQFGQALSRLMGSPPPSLNCDSERQVKRDKIQRCK